jgi:predicted metal-dependent hydrolase
MAHNDCIMWGTVEIPFSYLHTCRKTIGISVHPDLSVTVRAPHGTSVEAIRAFVYRRGSWISKSCREFEQYLPRQPERRYISGETHRYLGRQFRLKVDRGEADSVKCLRGYMWILTKSDPTPEKAKVLLEDWYRHHAKKVFFERLLVCHQRVLREEIPFPRVIIRKMTGRWGSYSSKGTITLNLELIKATKECIDYVITHELCHFKVKHHGPKFWSLLERIMPDFEERRKKLNLFAA